MERGEIGPRCNPSLHQRALAQSGIRGGDASFSRPIATRTIVGWLMAGIVFATGATRAMASQIASGQDLGSTRDYMQTDPGFYMQSDPADPPTRVLS